MRHFEVGLLGGRTPTLKGVHIVLHTLGESEPLPPFPHTKLVHFWLKLIYKMNLKELIQGGQAK